MRRRLAVLIVVAAVVAPADVWAARVMATGFEWCHYSAGDVVQPSASESDGNARNAIFSDESDGDNNDQRITTGLPSPRGLFCNHDSRGGLRGKTCTEDANCGSHGLCASEPNNDCSLEITPTTKTDEYVEISGPPWLTSAPAQVYAHFLLNISEIPENGDAVTVMEIRDADDDLGCFLRATPGTGSEYILELLYADDNPECSGGTNNGTECEPEEPGGMESDTCTSETVGEASCFTAAFGMSILAEDQWYEIVVGHDATTPGRITCSLFEGGFARGKRSRPQGVCSVDGGACVTADDCVTRRCSEYVFNIDVDQDGVATCDDDSGCAGTCDVQTCHTNIVGDDSAARLILGSTEAYVDADSDDAVGGVLIDYGDKVGDSASQFEVGWKINFDDLVIDDASPDTMLALRIADLHPTADVAPPATGCIYCDYYDNSTDGTCHTSVVASCPWDSDSEDGSGGVAFFDNIDDALGCGTCDAGESVCGGGLTDCTSEDEAIDCLTDCVDRGESKIHESKGFDKTGGGGEAELVMEDITCLDSDADDCATATLRTVGLVAMAKDQGRSGTGKNKMLNLCFKNGTDTNCHGDLGNSYNWINVARHRNGAGSYQPYMPEFFLAPAAPDAGAWTVADANAAAAFLQYDRGGSGGSVRVTELVAEIEVEMDAPTRADVPDINGDGEKRFCLAGDSVVTDNKLHALIGAYMTQFEHIMTCTRGSTLLGDVEQQIGPMLDGVLGGRQDCQMLLGDAGPCDYLMLVNGVNTLFGGSSTPSSYCSSGDDVGYPCVYCTKRCDNGEPCTADSDCTGTCSDSESDCGTGNTCADNTCDNECAGGSCDYYPQGYCRGGTDHGKPCGCGTAPRPISDSRYEELGSAGYCINNADFNGDETFGDHWLDPIGDGVGMVLKGTCNRTYLGDSPCSEDKGGEKALDCRTNVACDDADDCHGSDCDDGECVGACAGSCKGGTDAGDFCVENDDCEGGYCNSFCFRSLSGFPSGDEGGYDHAGYATAHKAYPSVWGALGCVGATNCSGGLCMSANPVAEYERGLMGIVRTARSRTGTQKAHIIVAPQPASEEGLSGLSLFSQHRARQQAIERIAVQLGDQADDVSYLNLDAYFTANCAEQNRANCLRDTIHWSQCTSDGHKGSCNTDVGIQHAAEAMSACFSGLDGLADGVCSSIASSCTSNCASGTNEGEACVDDGDCPSGTCVDDGLTNGSCTCTQGRLKSACSAHKDCRVYDCTFPTTTTTLP